MVYLTRKEGVGLLRMVLLMLMCFWVMRCHAQGAVVGDSFTFVEGNKAVTTIVVKAKGEASDDFHFATLLRENIQRITGVEIPIAEVNEQIKTQNQVLIGAIKNVPLIYKMLVNDGVIKSSEDLARRGYVRRLLPEDLGEQGFIIYKSRDGKKECLIVSGFTDVGTLYGVNTLADRLHIEGKRLIVDGLRTRLIPIINLPAFEYRSLQTAVGGPDFLGAGQYIKEFGYDYKSFVDWLASHKINNILLQDTCFTWGICYDSKKYPELVNKQSPNVKRDYIGDIINYGRKRGVTVFLMQNFPDRCDGVTKVCPELCGVREDGTRHPTTICLGKPEVMSLWKGFWQEILQRYPGVEAIGCQFGEKLSDRCKCQTCGSEAFFRKQREFFDVMADVAKAQNPPVKTWIWAVPGARDIIANRENYKDLTLIDWDVQFLPFMLGHRLPRGDWYLFHRYGKNPEFAMKQICISLAKCGMSGIQIRAVQFKERDSVFQSLEEFSWNPQLSIDDYAYLYTIKELRRKDKNIASAYAHYIRAQGYYEILSARDKNRGTDKARNYKTGMPSEQWIKYEKYEDKFKEEMRALKETLARISDKSDFVQWLKSQAKVDAMQRNLKTISVNIVNSDGSVRTIELIRPDKGGGYIGPKGEFYKRLPERGELKKVYGF